MKKLLFLTVAMLSVLISTAQNPIVINGKIENCPNRDNSRVKMAWFNTKTLRQETQVTNFSIAEDGRFYVKINNVPPGFNRYWIHMGTEVTHVDLCPGDSIYMTLNAEAFDESIQYSGIGAGRASYRRDVFLQFWDKNKDNEINDIWDREEFEKAVDRKTEQRRDLLVKYIKTGEIDSSYYRLQSDIIQFHKINTIANRCLYTPEYSKLLNRKLSEYPLNLMAISSLENQYLQYDEYRDLVTKLPEIILKKTFIHTRLTIDQKIDYAEKNYPDTTLLYYKSRIIDTCTEQARNRGELNELLQYFKGRFNEPLLKNRINEGGKLVQGTRKMNRFVETMLIFCFWILFIAGVLFLILKITSRIRPRSRFNLSLWSKVAFYLIVACFAFAFMQESRGEFKSLFIIILFLGTFLLHTYVLIPRLALRSKYRLYLGCLPALIFLNIGAISLVSNRIHPSDQMLQMATAVASLFILSWISYYIHQIASQKSTFGELIKSGRLNLEMAFNITLVFFINSIFLAGAGSTNIEEQALVFYSIILIFYLHVFISFPRFFNKEKILQFFGMLVAVTLGASLAMIVIDAVQSQHALQNIGIESSLFKLFSYRSIHIEMLMVYTLLLVPAFVYYFTKKQFQNMERTGFKLYRKKEAELAQLRSQVNPHFLFNTLNTLYAFALKEGSEKTAECIAKLANLMRFMLDDMEKESILLQREVSYIQDYVKLQSIRSAVEHDISITVDIEHEQGYSIAPMLLIPFVENAFKHGMNPNKISQLKVDITGKGNKIQFVIENSIDENFEAYYKEKGFGIGIENVKSRLEHIYPNRHNISIAKTNNKFIVILTVDIW